MFDSQATHNPPKLGAEYLEGVNTMTTITNNDGGVVTHINVMQLFTYDVDQIVADLLDSVEPGSNDVEITFDMVMDRVRYLSDNDFDANSGQLIFQDQDGDDL